MEKKAEWSLVAAAWVLAIGVIALGLYAIHHFSEISASTSSSGQVRTFGTQQNPVDPIDGQPVTIDSNTPRVNYNGTIYYFDGEKDTLGRDHKMLFLMDPLHYLTGSAPLVEPAQLTVTSAAEPNSVSGSATDITPTALPSSH